MNELAHQTIGCCENEGRNGRYCGGSKGKQVPLREHIQKVEEEVQAAHSQDDRTIDNIYLTECTEKEKATFDLQSVVKREEQRVSAVREKTAFCVLGGNQDGRKLASVAKSSRFRRCRA